MDSMTFADLPTDLQRDVFDHYDIDQSGALEARELRCALLEMGFHPQDKVIESLFRAFGEIHGDGRRGIPFENFAHVVSQQEFWRFHNQQQDGSDEDEDEKALVVSPGRSAVEALIGADDRGTVASRGEHPRSSPRSQRDLEDDNETDSARSDDEQDDDADSMHDEHSYYSSEVKDDESNHDALIQSPMVRS